jgi:prepilin-type N-terminal cleavage/methylation domain-containing protein
MVERSDMKKLFNNWRLTTSGFTLLELLIVIAVAAILVSVASASYSTVQKKARDGKRMGDMKAVQNAAEQYYADFSSEYPDQGEFTSAYLPNGFPSDPKPNPYPTYFYAHGTTPESYCTCADLEGTTGNSSSGTNCTSPATNGGYFCVKNLQ